MTSDVGFLASSTRQASGNPQPDRRQMIRRQPDARLASIAAMVMSKPVTVQVTPYTVNFVSEVGVLKFYTDPERALHIEYVSYFPDEKPITLFAGCELALSLGIVFQAPVQEPLVKAVAKGETNDVARI